MSRLTRKSLKTDMVWFVDHDNNMELEPYEMSAIHNRLVLQKLAEYEEIGLTPQQIQIQTQVIKENTINEFKRRILIEVGGCGMINSSYLIGCIESISEAMLKNSK